jgi:hypothetical protein
VPTTLADITTSTYRPDAWRVKEGQGVSPPGPLSGVPPPPPPRPARPPPPPRRSGVEGAKPPAFLSRSTLGRSSRAKFEFSGASRVAAHIIVRFAIWQYDVLAIVV